jgi:hypothetical protein
LTTLEEDTMFDETRNRKADLGMAWIKAVSGNTYLCPASAVVSLREASEDDLRKICLDESANPQNN